MIKSIQLLKCLKKQIINGLYYLKIMKRYSPYCPYCTSCGETGCCKPTICINHPKGHYCQTNQDELKISFWTLNEFWNTYFEEEAKKENYTHTFTKETILKEVEAKLDEIYEKHYDEQWEYRTKTNE